MKKFKSALALILALIMAVSCAYVAFAADEETEPNDTIATAAEFGTSATGALSSIDDVDYYVTEIAQAGVATLTINNKNADAELKIAVLDKDEKEVQSFTAAAGTSTTSSKFNVVAAKYYVKVAAGTVQGTDGYVITLSVNTTALTDVEPNNEMATASAAKIYEGTKQNWSTCPVNTGVLSKGDVDYYSFTVTNTEGYMLIRVDNDTTDKGDYKITLVQASNNKTICVFELKASQSYVTSADIGTPKGDYYLKVEGADAEASGTYSFRVNSIIDSASESEYNNETAYATYLQQGATKYASISYPNDKDIYKFVSTKDTKITVTPAKDERNNESSTWTANLYSVDEKGTIKKLQSVVVSSSQNAVFDLSKKQGTFYVTVLAGENYSMGNYIITNEKYTPEVTPSKPTTIGQFFDQLTASIKQLDWVTWWKNNFAPLLSNIDMSATLKSLWNLSVGTIIKFIKGQQ